MKLPISFTKEKKENPEVFLALVLKNEKIISVIFEKIGNAIKYISHDEEYFKNTIEDAETEEFLDTLDKVITSSETALPENVEAKKTIFGLKENWVEEGKIKKEYLEKLKKASDELSLEPIGFLVSAESIINLVTKEEGAPITAILCDIGKKYITVSWVKGGKVLETKSSEIHQSTSYTVDTLLKHFQSPGNLPARIILLDSEEDELTQEFISHQWSKSLAFLHLPQIASLEEDASVKAVLLGAATQMATQLIYDPSKNMDDSLSVTKIIPDEIERPQKEEKDFEKTKEDEAFKDEEKKQSLDYVSGDSSMEFFGFVENSDVAKTQIPKSPPGGENIPEGLIEEKTESIPEDVKLEEEKKQGFAVNATLVSGKVKKFLIALPAVFRKSDFNFISLLKTGNKKIFAVLGIIFILILSLGYVYLFATKAVVNVFVNPKEDEKTASVTFSSVSSTDIKNDIIAAQFVSVTEEGSVTRSATGKKDIGNSAKGSVTVFNISDDTVNLAAGTIIISANNLKFTLDSSVKIASGSSDPLNPKSATANVNVTAGEIGQEYNLPSGTKFTIGNNTSLAAKNDSAFSGGSKKQVTVVSEDDLNKLVEDLPKSLEDNARESIKGKVDAGKTMLNTFVDETVDDKSFDKKEDEQANQVTLKGTVIFKAASYTNSDIEAFASSLFDSKDNKIQSSNLEISAKNIVVEKNNDVNADLTIKAKIFPRVDKNSILKQVQGTSLQKAKNILSNLNQVTNVEISFSPNIPFLPKVMPRNSKNIILNLTSN